MNMIDKTDINVGVKKSEYFVLSRVQMLVKYCDLVYDRSMTEAR